MDDPYQGRTYQRGSRRRRKEQLAEPEGMHITADMSRLEGASGQERPMYPT